MRGEDWFDEDGMVYDPDLGRWLTFHEMGTRLYYLWRQAHEVEFEAECAGGAGPGASKNPSAA